MEGVNLKKYLYICALNKIIGNYIGFDPELLLILFLLMPIFI
jgi:hypothetical protein